MLSTIIAVLFLSSAPVLVSAVQCNVCREGIRLNYTLTNATVPVLPPRCTTMQGESCGVSVIWDISMNVTFLEFEARREGPGNAVGVRLVRGMERNNETLWTRLELDIECQSSDKCNSPEQVQKAISALTVKDQFQEELAPLLKTVAPFDPRAAECLYTHNETARCPRPDLRNCRRCGIEEGHIGSSPEEVCATCVDQRVAFDNNAERFKFFNLKDQTQNGDFAGLACQLKGCNTVDNANIVFKASTITFNTEQYLKN